MTWCRRRKAYGLVNLSETNGASVCAVHANERRSKIDGPPSTVEANEPLYSIFIRCVRGVSALHIQRVRNPFNALFTSYA